MREVHGVCVWEHIRIMTFIFPFYSTLELMQSKIAFWTVIAHAGLDIAITMTKTFFSPNLKPFSILILLFNIFFYLSQIHIICKLNQHRPRTKSFKTSVEIFFQVDINQPSLGMATEAQVHHSELSFCLHFFIFRNKDLMCSCQNSCWKRNPVY